MLTQEDIDEAATGQAEYWGRVTDNHDYWKTCKLSNKNLDAFRNLDSIGGFPNVDWCLQPSLEGYEAFTRWRLSQHVDKHVNWIFVTIYNAVKDFTGDSSLAMTAAEHAKIGVVQTMKARFP